MTDPTIPPQDSDAPIFDTLCRAADLAVNAGLAYARADDPHRFATLAQEFDNGRAVRRLVLEYRAAGQVRVVLRLDGYKHGEQNTVEVFSTTLQGKGATMLQPRTESLAARLFAWVNGGWSRHRRALDRRRLEHIRRAHGTSRSIAIRIVRDYFAPEGKPDAE